MCQHYTDVIMTTMASQITSLTVVYTTVYSDADQRKHQSSTSLAFVCGIHRDRWIPRTKGQLRGKCFHLMTSSWARFMGPILGPSGAARTQVGPMLAPWTLLSGYISQWNGSLLTLVITCHLFGANPLSKPMRAYNKLYPMESLLTYCLLETPLYTIFNEI